MILISKTENSKTLKTKLPQLELVKIMSKKMPKKTHKKLRNKIVRLMDRSQSMTKTMTSLTTSQTLLLSRFRREVATADIEETEDAGDTAEIMIEAEVIEAEEEETTTMVEMKAKIMEKEEIGAAREAAIEVKMTTKKEMVTKERNTVTNYKTQMIQTITERLKMQRMEKTLASLIDRKPEEVMNMAEVEEEETEEATKEETEEEITEVAKGQKQLEEEASVKPVKISVMRKLLGHFRPKISSSITSPKKEAVKVHQTTNTATRKAAMASSVKESAKAATNTQKTTMTTTPGSTTKRKRKRSLKEPTIDSQASEARRRGRMMLMIPAKAKSDEVACRFEGAYTSCWFLQSSSLC